ncbi:DNA repair protein [Shewanella sp. 10N.286.48.A6]|uniref:DNA repair protein n=1 Tax=Shewanella sp. 10N.286.48.A6 TaxID=1880833 RepID=UPI000C81A01A|nr:DNA repair protein [Shewanella sp. 10N.286.48.A6]PMI01881.1 DNA repair protein [Shewanella sp. 10N.286.48.A6]
MGLWSSFKSGCSKVWNSGKKLVSECVDKVKTVCTKVWNAFTGKNYTDEAEALLAEINERYDKARSKYQAAVKGIGDDIEDKVSKINSFKTDIYNHHFKRFINVSSRLKNVTVKGQPFGELFDDSILDVKDTSGVSSKKDLILIDFNKMTFIDTAAMIFTLGIFSRKKAKESLEKVKQEEVRVYEEITKLESQSKKLQVISESVDNVIGYFGSLIRNYEALLNRFEYGIQTQRFKQMANSENIFSHNLDFKLIPIVHIEEFHALFNLSIVLKQMATLGYLSENGEVIDKDESLAESLSIKVNYLAQKVA